MAMAPPVIRVKQLQTWLYTKRGTVKAVDGVSFLIRNGETLGLVGESGSGKSITCLLLIGLVPEPAGRIVAGEIIFEGRDLLRNSARDFLGVRGRKICMIPQDPMGSLNPALTIGDQIGESVRLHQGLRGSAVRQRVIELLRQVRIPDAERLLDTYPHAFSGGMRQRVVAAIALAPKPAILIADEPTTSLDVTTAAEFLALLKALQAECGVAVLFVTHDFGIVQALCDRVAVMYAGRIVETGGTRELLANACHPYTQGLINCVPKAAKPGARLSTIEGDPPDPLRLPSGCSFFPRCARRAAVCSESFPPEVVVTEGHVASCWCV